MAWPCRAALWKKPAMLEEAKIAYAEVARTIAGFEPVMLVANVGDGREAIDACGLGVDVVEWPIDDSWARDIGAIVVTNDAGDRRGVDFGFNAWGEKFSPYDEDQQFAARMCERLGIERDDATSFVLEGGAISVDGEGTLLTTEECLLDPNRNPSLSRGDIEDRLRRWVGVERVVWLPYGLVEDDDTDGHVDNVAMFIAPGVVLAQATNDAGNPNHDRLRANIDALHRAGLEVVEVDVLPYAEVDGERCVVPPTNLYLANAGAIVPIAQGDGGERALDAIARAIPDREVVGVPGEVLAYGGGGVHCITQQVPSSSAPRPRMP